MTIEALDGAMNALALAEGAFNPAAVTTADIPIKAVGTTEFYRLARELRDAIYDVIVMSTAQPRLRILCPAVAHGLLLGRQFHDEYRQRLVHHTQLDIEDTGGSLASFQLPSDVLGAQSVNIYLRVILSGPDSDCHATSKSSLIWELDS